MSVCRHSLWCSPNCIRRYVGSISADIRRDFPRDHPLSLPDPRPLIRFFFFRLIPAANDGTTTRRHLLPAYIKAFITDTDSEVLFSMWTFFNHRHYIILPSDVLSNVCLLPMAQRQGGSFSLLSLILHAYPSQRIWSLINIFTVSFYISIYHCWQVFTVWSTSNDAYATLMIRWQGGLFFPVISMCLLLTLIQTFYFHYRYFCF